MFNNKIILLVTFLCVVIIDYGQSVNFRVDPLVLIEQGLVRGVKATDGDYSMFLGIPYAQVDLQNPFGPSLPHPGFGEEIFEANNGLTKCPQPAILPNVLAGEANEKIDCLTLNVYVPHEASTRNPLPVMVWVHGGGFYYGSAGDDGVPYLAQKGVVVVMMNYRLGPYGFMCLDSPLAPGNQGLKDQYESLEWVRKNIAAFGGNPYNITLGGLSAGGASVFYHLYSDKEKLYNKIISHSGVPKTAGIFVDGDVDAAIKIANHLGLNTDDTEEALNFLAQTPHKLVIAAYHDLGLRLMPCKERSFSGVDVFLDTEPDFFTNERKVRDTPILIGNTDREIVSELDYLNDIFYSKIKEYFNWDDDKTKYAAEIIKHFYIGDATPSTNLSTKFDEFDSDFTFNHPIQRTITDLLNENANPIYEYLFTFTRDPDATGADHAIDQKYLFVMEQYSYNTDFSEEDYLIKDIMNEFWANFIKIGNPTPSTSDIVPVTWDAVSQDSRPFLIIDRDTRMDSRVFNSRMAFWDLFYATYGKPDV